MTPTRAVPPEGPPATADDARIARGDQTRRALLDALLALVREGHARPTVADVAARARVSVRIVYYHFGGIRELLVAAVSLQAERCRHLLFGVTPNGPLELRISALCRQRRLYFEEMMPVFGTALARAHGRNGFRALLVDERTLLRSAPPARDRLNAHPAACRGRPPGRVRG